MNLVSTAPHAKSIFCLHSAESASFMSGSVRSLNAVSISSLVNALNLALFISLPSVSRSLTASIPMSSPSRS